MRRFAPGNIGQKNSLMQLKTIKALASRAILKTQKVRLSWAACFHCTSSRLDGTLQHDADVTARSAHRSASNLQCCSMLLL
jgi:hypothetical protein